MLETAKRNVTRAERISGTLERWNKGWNREPVI